MWLPSFEHIEESDGGADRRTESGGLIAQQIDYVAEFSEALLQRASLEEASPPCPRFFQWWYTKSGFFLLGLASFVASTMQVWVLRIVPSTHRAAL